MCEVSGSNLWREGSNDTLCENFLDFFLNCFTAFQKGVTKLGEKQIVLRISQIDYSVTSGDWVKKQFQARHFQPNVNLVQTQIKITSVKPNYEHSC